MYDSIFEYHFHLASVHFIDILLCIILFFIAVISSNLKKSKLILIKGNEHYKYYTYNTLFKVSFALLFAGVYLLIYNGGDTTAYFHGATKLNNLFWSSPIDYFQEMMATPDLYKISLRFTPETGYPDGGIYKEPESFFISKILSVLMFLTGQHYLTLTVLIGWITAKISWKVYELVLYYKISTEKLAALAVLFIPSVGFWCSGITKDTIILIATLYILNYGFELMNKTTKNKIVSIFFILFGFYTLLHTRSFMAFTIGIPLLVAFSARTVRKHADNPFYANTIRVIIFVFISSLTSFIMVTQKNEIQIIMSKYMNEAEVTQKDFLQNKNYGKKKYDLGITDYSITGMIKSAPIAIITALYRPFLWEARSLQLFISGVETFIFLILTVYFFVYGKVLKKIHLILSNELLLFALFFTIILAFFAGFTSILFGVLVRFKAPFLPFFIMLLTVRPVKKIKTQTND